jgi:hypothetical protein
LKTSKKTKVNMVSAFAVLFLYAGSSLIGCGGTGARNASDKDKGEIKDSVELTGEISVRGSDIAPMVLLKAEDGTMYTIQSSPIASELARLEGMSVRIHGSLRLPAEDGPALIEAGDYRILPLESGEVPLIGWIVGKEQGCLLKDVDGTEWFLIGDLTSHLSDFDGAKVWVVGERRQTETKKSEIQVTGYGVLTKKY